MSFATAEDGTRIHFEEAGTGIPVLFIHGFAGDHRSWEPQMRTFSRRSGRWKLREHTLHSASTTGMID